MNKIIIENNIVKYKELDDSIIFNYSVSDTFESVYNLEIKCLNSTDLCINYNITNDIKINVLFEFEDNVVSNIFEKYNDGFLKIKNTYNLKSFSEVNVQKIYDVKEIKQNDIVNLNGEKSSFNYVLKTISINPERYGLVINHNAPYTVSNIINNAVNICDGSVFFDVIGNVPKGIIECSLNQNNRIVTFNKKKCQINPNLLIDEDNVIAEHSAFIGKFNDEDLFYLQSRGITYEEAIKLLIKGFLFSNLKLTEQDTGDLENIIHKYWR